jgi:hypothetical protein
MSLPSKPPGLLCSTTEFEKKKKDIENWIFYSKNHFHTQSIACCSNYACKSLYKCISFLSLFSSQYFSCTAWGDSILAGTSEDSSVISKDKAVPAL